MKNYKKIILGIILSLLALGCIIASLPPLQNLALSFAEQYLNRPLRNPKRWAEIVMHTAFLGLFLVAIVAIFVFTKLGKETISDSHKFISNFSTELKNRKSIIALTVITCFYLLCFYEVMASDYLYQDDMFRHYSGNRSWIGFGHYLAEFTSILFHNSIRLHDIHPLIQILSIFVMVITTILIDFLLSKKINIIGILLLSFIFISPFYAQNMSYRYDALYMTLSIFFAVIPFIFKDNIKTFLFTSFICLNFSLMSYQPGTDLYIILTIYIVYTKLQCNTTLKDSTAWKFSGFAIVGYALSLLFYNSVFANTISSEGYFDVSVSLSSIPSNLIKYTQSIVQNFGGVWLKCFFIIAFIISIVLCIKNSKQKKWISILLTVMALSIAFCLSYGPYIIFSRPPFTMRSYFGFNILVALILYDIYQKTRLTTSTQSYRWGGVLNKLLLIPSLCIIFGCTVFLYAYGTCLSDQKKYEEFRVTSLLSDLNHFADSSEKKYFTIVGKVGNSNAYKNAERNYPIISKIISGLPCEGSTWNDEYFNLFNFNCEEIYLEDLPTDQEFPLLLSTNYHDIYGSGNYFYIVLK